MSEVNFFFILATIGALGVFFTLQFLKCRFGFSGIFAIGFAACVLVVYLFRDGIGHLAPSAQSGSSLSVHLCIVVLFAAMSFVSAFRLVRLFRVKKDGGREALLYSETSENESGFLSLRWSIFYSACVLMFCVIATVQSLYALVYVR